MVVLATKRSKNLTLFAHSPDGVRIAYDSVGEGRPIVLIHGFASSREQNWRSTGWIDRLAAAGFRVVSFDCRGHGKSDKPHQPAAYGEHMIDDILAVMDAAQARKEHTTLAGPWHRPSILVTAQWGPPPRRCA